MKMKSSDVLTKKDFNESFLALVHDGMVMELRTTIQSRVWIFHATSSEQNF